MSELLDKQVNAQKESLKNFECASFHKSTQKCAIKMKETNDMLKIFFDGRKEFIRLVQKTCVTDIN